MSAKGLWKPEAVLTTFMLIGLLLVGCRGEREHEDRDEKAAAAEQTTEAESTNPDGQSSSPTVENPPDSTPTELPTAAPDLTLGDWTRIEAGGEARCAHDTPFAFWTRKGDERSVLVYFQGGGGCWDAETCAPGSTYYDANVDARDDPMRAGGILDIDNPQNPFRDYTMVYVPSCTGDVHWGDIVREYEGQDGELLTIYHRGFVNGQSALAWLFDNVSEPEKVLVTGCSAGSVGSIVHAPFVIEHYPEAEVSQLGDSLAFVFHRPLNIQEGYNARANFPPWIEELRQLSPDELLMSEYYTAVASYYPDRRFSQFNTRADRVQQFYFTALGGEPQAFTGALLQSLDDIRQEAANFLSYTAAGTMHCITPRPEFYSLETGDTRFISWLEKLVDGEQVDSVTCSTCDLGGLPD